MVQEKYPARGTPHRLQTAKKPATREKRMQAIIEMLARGESSIEGKPTANESEHRQRMAMFSRNFAY
jgi:hypothetical protein